MPPIIKDHGSASVCTIVSFSFVKGEANWRTKGSTTIYRTGLRPGSDWGSLQRYPDPLDGGKRLATAFPKPHPLLDPWSFATSPPVYSGIAQFRLSQICLHGQSLSLPSVQSAREGYPTLHTQRQRGRGGSAYLDGVETADDAPVLDVDVRRRMRVAAVGVRPAAALTGELATHLQRQPPGVLPRPRRRRRRRAGWSSGGQQQRRGRRRAPDPGAAAAAVRHRLPAAPARRQRRRRQRRGRRRHHRRR